jgi:hypothetical protein
MNGCQNCEKLKTEVARVLAENNALGEALIKQANVVLHIRRILDEAGREKK